MKPGTVERKTVPEGSTVSSLPSTTKPDELWTLRTLTCSVGPHTRELNFVGKQPGQAKVVHRDGRVEIQQVAGVNGRPACVRCCDSERNREGDSEPVRVRYGIHNH